MENSRIWCIPLGEGRALLYAPYHGITTLVNRASVDCVRRFLCDPEREIPEGLEWISSLRGPGNVPEVRHGDPDPLYLGLIPTRACTMQCAYCDFAPDRAYPRMSFDLIRRAVDGYAGLLRKCGAGEWQMHFFGGEPFAAFRESVFALNYARQKAAELGIPTHFEVTTNGFYPEDRCRWIADNFDTVVLSFDGFSDTQNIHRPAPGGQDSFMTVCRNADIFAHGNCELIIRSCVSSGNIDELPKWASFIAERFFPASVVLEPMIESPLARRNGLCPPDPDRFMQSWTAAYRILRSQRIPLIYSSGEISSLKTSLCPMGQDAMIVTPDGAIGGCWQLAENRRQAGIDLGFGTVTADGLRIDREALDHQRDLSAENRERCRNCFCYAHCAGGCLLNRENKTDFCRMTRALTLWQLLEQLGYGRFADILLADKSFSAQMAKDSDYSLYSSELPEDIAYPSGWETGSPEPDLPFDFSRLTLPQLPPDPVQGWVRDGDRIFLTDADRGFIDVPEGDEALRFQLEHSGMSAADVGKVWTALHGGTV